jgi:hypothetical protein
MERGVRQFETKFHSGLFDDPVPSLVALFAIKLLVFTHSQF